MASPPKPPPPVDENEKKPAARPSITSPRKPKKQYGQIMDTNSITLSAAKRRYHNVQPVPARRLDGRAITLFPMPLSEVESFGNIPPPKKKEATVPWMNKEQYEEKIANQEIELNDLKSKTIFFWITQMREEILSLKNENKELKSKVEHLENENKELKSKVEHLENENSALKSKVEHLESEVEHLENENSALKSKVENLESKVEHLENENSALKSEISFLRAQ